ncbi:hypothetical protein JG687_00003054 [Phytophthora cactorum]|uniref:Uncharacterized protein n=1 Tax=Phytophthora cactorum TaxID=29920 RepID=A0A329T0A0_9STRA|nr:hypothetical protein Pcac1_g8979 [Phytophthora cactorum]KAG2845875.1 hypothetical protein PC112_g1707 [Phytophthora cactorum]KAG2847456.1 hypothetical protein PC111_g830 [Phytophthora cactorum]KAG2868150.1 hypothetical protein PC113_g1366 [Phytophthora cactorum]KAG2933005.1 hypothetical protein PC114_g1647 [Phytophthora cactorum]
MHMDSPATYHLLSPMAIMACGCGGHSPPDTAALKWAANLTCTETGQGFVETSVSSENFGPVNQLWQATIGRNGQSLPTAAFLTCTSYELICSDRKYIARIAWHITPSSHIAPSFYSHRTTAAIFIASVSPNCLSRAPTHFNKPYIPIRKGLFLFHHEGAQGAMSGQHGSQGDAAELSSPNAG